MTPFERAKKRAKNIKLMIFDVDGILTDGSICYTEEGSELKIFNVQDGLGMKMLKESGVLLAILSSRISKSVERRAKELEIEFLMQGIKDKYMSFQNLLSNLRLQNKQIAYMGDDLPDLKIMRQVALAITVPSAPSIIKKHAHYITKIPGGKGAAREACELIMHAQNTYKKIVSNYL